MREMLGRILGGRYEILERLGTGGMAEVYKGRHIQLDRLVAIKIMHGFLAADPQFQQRFEREARSIAQLRHTNIIQVYDFAKEGDLFYMVMEYVDGKALDQRLRELAEQETILPKDELFTITRSIAGALEYAHNRGMIHRDIKPSNVMIDQDGRVILMDFGIARIVGGTQLTASGAMMGTPAYMPPEHGLGISGDHRADLYSFGVMIFEMATGHLPFQAETPLAVVLSHVNDPLPLPSSVNPNIDERIAHIILRLTEKKPEDRYQTASELIADLESDQIPEMPPRSDENIATTKPPAASAPTVPGEATEPAIKPPISQSRRLIMGAGAAIIAVIAILLLVIGSQGSSSDTPTPTTRAAAADLATSTDTPVKANSPIPSRIAAPTRTPTETPDLDATQEFLAPTLTEQAMQTAIARATELEFDERTRIAEVVGNTRAALTVESARYTAAAATLTAEAPTATPTFTPSDTLTPSNTPTLTLTPSDTPTRTLTPSNTPTATHTPSNTPTHTHTPSDTPSNTPTRTYTPSDTPTLTYTPSNTPTFTFTPSDTPTHTFTPSDTPTPTPTPTITPNLTATQAVLAPTQTRQATETLVAEATAAAAAQKTSIARVVQNTRNALSTERALNTAAAATLTAEAPTATFTYTPSDTPTSSLTPSQTLTPTSTPTRTPDYVATQERETFVALLTQLAPTATPTPSDTPTATPTATFTPEGGGPGNIVFSADIRGEQEVFVVPVGGPPEDGPAPITQNPSGDQGAAWSPDGKRIAFASDRDGDWDIYVMGTDGILLAQVTNVPGSDMMPSWSPDGQRLVFVSDRAGTLELYMTYADGRDPFSAQLLTTGGSAKTDPAWSPDGTDILYVRWQDNAGTLYLIGADGSDPRSIYGGGFPSAKTSSPAWSPDGRRIAFAANLEGDDAEIYTVDEFGRLAQLTDNDVDDLRPAWSPAGDWIAFGRESVEGNAFYRVRADGTDEQVIWDGAGALSVQGMAWQPPEDALIAPTNTPIASPTPRATSTPTATPTPEACTVKLTQAANIRLGPTTGWGIVTTGAVGDIFDVLGKNSFGTWWKLDLPGIEYDGWVSISLTEYDEAACADVPIAEAPRPAVQPTDPPPTDEDDEDDEGTTAEAPTAVPEGEDVPIELWHEPVSCIYVGDMDYSCRVNIYINGGSPPFTMWHNDNRYSGYTPQEIIVQWRRCDIATFGVRVHDDTGLPGHDVQQGFAIDPSAYGSVFPGGSCTLP